MSVFNGLVQFALSFTNYLYGTGMNVRKSSKIEMIKLIIISKIFTSDLSCSGVVSIPAWEYLLFQHLLNRL